jgi:Flp pilus assembly protein TadD
LLRAAFAAGQATPRYPELGLAQPGTKTGSANGKQAFEEGRSLVREKRYRDSIPHFLEAAAQGEVEAQLYLGIAYANSGDSARAAWHYEEFVHLAPGHKSAPQATEILRQYFANSPRAKPRYALP